MISVLHHRKALCRDAFRMLCKESERLTVAQPNVDLSATYDYLLGAQEVQLASDTGIAQVLSNRVDAGVS